MRLRLVFLFSLLAVIAVARNARAQFTGGLPAGFGSLNVSPTSSDSAKGDTPGVKVSDSMVLHTGLAVSAGVDSNIFYQDTGAQSAAVTHIMPQLSLGNGGRGVIPEYVFSLMITGDYRQYYSDLQTVKDEASAFGVGVGANLTLGRDTQVTGALFNNFIRDVQASYIPGTGEFSRDVEQAGGRLNWRPGGGRLEESLGYTFQYDHYEEQLLSFADDVSNTIDLRSAFKFLPKTAWHLDLAQGFVTYTNKNAGKNGSKPFHAQLGLTGLITAKLSANLSVGYGNGFYDAGPSPSTVVGIAELSYRVGPFSALKVGYEHDFVNSVYGNFYDLDAVYAGWNQQVGNSFMGTLSTRYEHRVYHCAMGQDMAAIACFNDPTQSDQNRRDNWISLMVSANYFPRPWFSVGASYLLLANVSDFQLMAGTAFDKVSFVKHQVVGVVSVTY